MNEATMQAIRDDDGYRFYLVEPELMDKAVLLDVDANETPLAIPVGKFRRGGNIEFLDRKEAEKAVKLLKRHVGFPNPRLVDLSDPSCPYFDVRWGDPPPFDGCDYSEPLCILLLGLYYGYKEKVVLEHVLKGWKEPRRSFSRKTFREIVHGARFSR